MNTKTEAKDEDQAAQQTVSGQIEHVVSTLTDGEKK